MPLLVLHTEVSEEATKAAGGAFGTPGVRGEQVGAEPGGRWATCCSTSRPGAGHAPADYRLVRAEGRGMKDLIGSGLVLGAGRITRQLCQKTR